MSTSIFTFAALAEETNSQGKEWQGRQFEAPKNMTFGKITSISEKSVREAKKWH